MKFLKIEFDTDLASRLETLYDELPASFRDDDGAAFKAPAACLLAAANQLQMMEEENARLALALTRIQQEREERMLTRVLTTVEHQAMLERDLKVVVEYVAMASRTVCGGREASDALLNIRNLVLSDV